eukprot:CAMPEP_0198140740 /NCGR_PEP_ID=MMETSP1443-20131203/3858_1 /TAXON_ID=186043 /ORGANISM="Entomoneis sp., Strain CCMP2396" /LENGTH=334 /DNA_ID=CAMNT_0043803261 /DNA_START=29 /DNA_END=1033 /DNA_ORIENTATION=-
MTQKSCAATFSGRCVGVFLLSGILLIQLVGIYILLYPSRFSDLAVASQRTAQVAPLIEPKEPAICLGRAYVQLCSTFDDIQAHACFRHPELFFRAQIANYNPSKEQIEARTSLKNVKALSVGAHKTGFCNDATRHRKTLCTDRSQLDLLEFTSWLSLLQDSPHDGLEVIFAEHVLEHFDPIQVARVAAAAFTMLREGGVFRLVVPDGFKPSPSYQHYARLGGSHSGGAPHMVFWTVDNISPIFESMGFVVRHREHFDARGNFHSAQDAYDHDATLGKVRRSFKHDKRNLIPYRDFNSNIGNLLVSDLGPDEPVYTSLWIDAIKPSNCTVMKIIS